MIGKVTLFGKEIVLDKKIIVSLDDGLEVFSMLKKEDFEEFSYAGSYEAVCKQISQRRPLIITCQTPIILPEVMELGYEIYIQSKNKWVCMSKLLGFDSNGEKSYSREIRETQNWEKMLYSGCFDIEVPSFKA